MIASWTCPGPAGAATEYALAFDNARERRLLVIPALFDEANRTRRMLVEAMRRIDAADIDCFLPDLPGCNESLQSFTEQSLDTWRAAMQAAAAEFGATHVLAVRGGALVAPAALPGLFYEPAKGATILRRLLRARTIASREAGREEDMTSLQETARQSGVELAGYRCGPDLITGLEAAVPQDNERRIVTQAELDGAGLWLRSEPDDNPAQSRDLAALVAAELGA